MNKIDSVGVYIGTITDSSVGETKNGFPQAVLKLTAKQKFISDPGDMKHFGIAEPGYVDWSEFNEESIAYLVLFKSTEVFDQSTKLLNYDQLIAAVGWDGVDFSNFGSFVGKDILFRVEENDYNGKVTLQVSWVDDKDAGPERKLKVLDGDKLKGLSAKLKLGMGGSARTKPVASSAVGKPKSAPVASSPPTNSAPVSAPAATESPSESPAPTAATSPTTPSGAPPTVTRRGRKPKADATAGPVTKLTKAEAWAAVDGKAEGEKVVDAWLTSCEQVGGEKDEAAFTEEDWLAVKDTTLKALGV